MTQMGCGSTHFCLFPIIFCSTNYYSTTCNIHEFKCEILKYSAGDIKIALFPLLVNTIRLDGTKNNSQSSSFSVSTSMRE